MRILVTGHRGFIGRNLYERLQGAHDLQGWNDPESMPVLDGLDWVIHLGAISSTTETDVDKIMRHNLEYSQELFRMCNKNKINFQYASSASVYGTLQEFKEDGGVAPQSPYSWTKYLFDRWVFQQERKIIVQGFRYFNVYGPHEEHKGDQSSPISKFEKQAREKKQIILFEGSEKYSRDFVYVGDVCSIHELFMEDCSSGIFNVGTGSVHNFKEIAQAIAKKFKAGIKEIPMPANIARQYQSYTRADMTRTKKIIGNFNFTDALDYIG